MKKNMVERFKNHPDKQSSGQKETRQLTKNIVEVLPPKGNFNPAFSVVNNRDMNYALILKDSPVDEGWTIPNAISWVKGWYNNLDNTSKTHGSFPGILVVGNAKSLYELYWFREEHEKRFSVPATLIEKTEGWAENLQRRIDDAREHMRQRLEQSERERKERARIEALKTPEQKEREKIEREKAMKELREYGKWLQESGYTEKFLKWMEENEGNRWD